MLINCVATRTGASLPTSAWTTSATGCTSPTPLSGCAARPVGRGAGADAAGIRPARAGRGGCCARSHQRPKIEEYGDMVFVVLHLPDPGRMPRRSARSRYSSGTTTCSRCGGAAGRIPGRAQALRARAAAAAPRLRLRAVCPDGRGGGPLFPMIDDFGVGTGDHRGADL